MFSHLLCERTTSLRDTTFTAPGISVAPVRALTDAALAIRLNGFAPGARVTLRAHTADEQSWRWESAATFAADERGEVDVAGQTPLAGSYPDADALGLLWSMTLDPAESDISPFAAQGNAPIQITLTAEAEGMRVTTTCMRDVASPKVHRIPVREDGIAGTFFRPSISEVHPGVLVLGGSGGGLREGQAALLASHGYPALALAYFAYEDLPLRLERIPLEYFERALAWMRQRDEVRGGAIAVLGASRGGELALLLGATLPDIAAVIAYAPSGVLWGAVGHDAPAWTYRGEPLPYMPNHVTEEQAAQLFAREPYAATPWYRINLEDAVAREACAVSVESIGGPVLLVSGEDDAMWPSTTMANLIMERLRAHDFAHSYEHLAYPDAGHLIWPLSCPGLPATVTARRNPTIGSSFAYGGTARGYAHAAAGSWRRVLALLGAI